MLFNFKRILRQNTHRKFIPIIRKKWKLIFLVWFISKHYIKHKCWYYKIFTKDTLNIVYCSVQAIFVCSFFYYKNPRLFSLKNLPTKIDRKLYWHVHDLRVFLLLRLFVKRAAVFHKIHESCKKVIRNKFDSEKE